jgi:hypothetical protein
MEETWFTECKHVSKYFSAVAKQNHLILNRMDQADAFSADLAVEVQELCGADAIVRMLMVLAAPNPTQPKVWSDGPEIYLVSDLSREVGED